MLTAAKTSEIIHPALLRAPNFAVWTFRANAQPCRNEGATYLYDATLLQTMDLNGVVSARHGHNSGMRIDLRVVLPNMSSHEVHLEHKSTRPGDMVCNK